MAWTTPRTWVTSELVGSSIMNSHIRDQFQYLHGDSGTVDLASTLRFGNGSTLRGHRHPYANERHVESGTATGTESGSGISVAVTFTDAFAATPVVVITPSDAGCSWSAQSRSTTGFTAVGTGSVGSHTACWVAEGQD